MEHHTVEMDKRKITADRAAEARNGGKEGHRKGSHEEMMEWTQGLANPIL